MATENELGKNDSNAIKADEQRARQMLDRALTLSEQGNLADAIIACRRAAALVPDMAQTWSMLALFYEQNHEIDKAIVAYEKVVEIAPSSAMEQESLQRLRLRQAQHSPTITSTSDDDIVLSDDIETDADEIWKDLPATSPATQWNSFYFRSFPLAVAALACMIILAAAQHSAHVQETTAIQKVSASSIPIKKPVVRGNRSLASSGQNSKSGHSSDGDAENAATTDPLQLSPDALAPHSDENAEETNDSEEKSPVPVPEGSTQNTSKESAQPEHKPASKPKSAPKPQSQHKPKTSSGDSQPFSVPALPRPQIKLPQRTESEPEKHFESKSESKSPAPKRDDSRADRPAPPLGEVGNATPPNSANSGDNAPVPDVPSAFPDADRD